MSKIPHPELIGAHAAAPAPAASRPKPDPAFETPAAPAAGASEPPRTGADLRAAAAGPLAQRLSPKYLEEHCLLPVGVSAAGELLVVADEPPDPTVIDELCWAYGRRVKLVATPAAEIHAAILSAQSESPPDVQATDLRGSDLVLLAEEEETIRDLGELGMPGPALERFEGLIRQPHGIILVTGPTGSGKTTTLYGALTRLNQAGVKIVTVEDPVEYQIDGVTQIPVNPKIGLTFAAALRSILRHDPDIIMVGEMRDRETAEIAIQAALTGHLVLSTLHTNDAPSGVTRMVDVGIEPYLVAATVLAIVGQRLVRLVCEACAEDFRPPADLVAQVTAVPDIPQPRFRRGRGCDTCAGTGYRGRTGLYELMPMSEDLRDRVVRRAPLAEIRALAQAQGMASLRASGCAKACAGRTTLEEVLRVTRDEALG